MKKAKTIFISLIILVTIITSVAGAQEDANAYLEEAGVLQTQGKINEAIEKLNKALETDPKLKRAYFMLGNIYIQESYFDKASEIFNRLKSIDPGDTKVLYLIGASDFLSFKYSSARENLEQILKAHPEDIMSRNYLSLVLFRLGQNENALNEIVKATRYNLKGEGDFTLYSDLSTLFFDMQKLSPSLEDLREIANNNKQNSYSYTILGWIAFNDNDPEEASQEFKKAIAVNNSDQIAHYLLGLVLYQRNDAKGAVTEYETALKMDKEFVKSVQDKYQYIEKAKIDEGVLEWENKLSEEPDNHTVMFELSEYYYARGSFAQAQELIQKAIKIKPQEAKYYNLLGKIYTKKYEWNNAIEAFKKASAEDQKNGEYQANLCYSYEKGGLFQEAIEAGEKAIMLNPSDKTFYNSMAISYYYLKDYDRAIESFKKVIKENSTNGEFLCRYAIALQAAGFLEEASKNYKEAIELSPKLLDSYYYLAHTLSGLGQYEEGAGYFQKVLDMRTNYQSIYAPNFNDVQISLANCMLALDKPESALEQLDTVINQDPLNPKAHLFKAYAYEKMNKPKEADEEFKKVYSLTSINTSDNSRKQFTPYSGKTVVAPEAEGIISYSVTISDRWTQIYLGEPQFAIIAPKRGEKEIKNDIKANPYNYKTNLELINFYLFNRKPNEAQKELGDIPEIDAFEMHNLKGMIYTLQKKTDLALIEFNKALEINSASYEAHNNIAVVYQILQNYSLATEHLKKSINLYFLNSWAYNNLGMIYQAQENYTSAEEDFYFAKVSDLNSPWIRHNLGWTYFKQNKIDDAIREMDEAIKLAPGEYTFPAHLGWIYHEKGDRENAILYYKKALSVNPHEANIYNTIGVALTEQNKYKEALEYYKKAIELAPTEEKYHRNLGIAYYRLNIYSEAQKEFEKALKINSFASENNLNLSSAFCKQGKLEEGSNYLNYAIYYNESNYSPIMDIMITNNQGALYLEQGKLDLAEKQFQSIINYKDTYKDLVKYLSSYYVETYNNMALLKYKQGTGEDAQKMLQNAKDLIEDYPDTINNMAFVLQDQDGKKARELYEYAIKLNPDRSIFYNNLGVLYFKEGDMEKAKEILKLGIEKDKNDQILNYNLGVLYFTQNLPQEASQLLKSIPEHARISPEANYLLGLIYYRQGKKILAQERYEKAISQKKIFEDFVETGWTYMSFQAYRLAQEKFAMALQINPDSGAGYVGMATYYFNMDLMDKAKEEAEKGIKADPDMERGYIIRSLIYYHSKEFDKAIEDLEKAIKLNPKNSLALYNYGYLLQEHGDLKKAMKAYEDAVSIDKDSTLAICAQGFVCFFNGEYEKAKANAYRVIGTDPTFSDAYYILGKVFEKQGNKNQAIFEYKRAMKIDPLHMDASEAIKRLSD